MSSTISHPTTTSDTINHSENSSTATTSAAMAPTTTTKPSSRSPSPPTKTGSRSHSPSNHHTFWSSYSNRLGGMHLSNGNEQPVEHHHGHRSKPTSKPSSKPVSGTATPERERKRSHNPDFLKTINARLDKAYETHARPTQEAAIEEVKKEGEERQRWGDKHVFGFLEKSLDRAHDSKH